MNAARFLAHARASGRSHGKADAHGKRASNQSAMARIFADGKRGGGEVLLDAPPAGGELDNMERLGGVAFRAFHNDDGRQRVIFHHVLATAHKERTRQGFSALHKRSGDCFHDGMVTATGAEVQNTRRVQVHGTVICHTPKVTPAE